MVLHVMEGSAMLNYFRPCEARVGQVTPRYARLGLVKP